MVFSKTRIAPTPSGFLHIGNAYSFFLTDCIARENNADILLRIDDIDEQRKEQRFIEDIFSTLSFLEIRWQEGPQSAADAGEYSQHRRIDLYKKILDELKRQNLVFACDCSRTEISRQPNGVYNGKCLHRKIPFDQPGVAWRLDTSRKIELSVNAFEGDQSKHFLPGEMHYFVVKRKEDIPSYQLTSLVDDLHFGIDMVVRGRDLFNSTLAQLYLAKVLGFEKFCATTFLHHGLILTAGGQKLSKSKGAGSVQSLISSGVDRKELIARIFGSISKEDQGKFAKYFLPALEC